MANSESSEMANDSKAEESQPPPPPEPPGFVGGSPTLVEELVAKSIAPVKREFLRPPPVRERKEGGGQESDKSISSNQVVKQKKSKRQLKRERREERKSALNLCPEVAKSGNTNSCRYGDKCRFSHDMESYKAQKPADLEGNCPFTSAERPCPYGLTCRFSGAHKDVDPDGKLNARKEFPEVNTLNKDVQKLLWKNKMKFLAADAALKGLGLASQGKGNSRIKTLEDKEENGHGIAHCTNGCQEIGCAKDDNSVNKEVCSPLSLEENSMEVASVDEESRPLKRAKPKVNEKSVAIEVTNGGNVSEENCDETLAKEVTRIESDVLPDIDGSIKLHPREKKIIDFRGQRYLAPLTTVGNLPFRRVCKVLGADVTCGEMAMCTNLLQGQASEWALLRRHTSEDLFGVQICGAYPDTVARAVELIERECSVDFIDINMGCPIDIVVNKGAGSALLTKPLRMKNVIQAACAAVETPITVKVRTGYFEGRNRVDSLIADIGKWGATAVTIHGRSRQQRYSKLADWEYIYECVKNAPESIQVLGNGDVFSYLDWKKHFSDCPRLSSCMIARGALIKPWIFTEIKEQRHWDISSGERLDILKDYVRFGLEHWGSDSKGVETTRHFLLEWLSYICRYIPIGLLDVVPQRLNWRPPSYFGRNDLETLMASDSAADWIRISELLLGKVPSGFTFAPKHKSNAYDSAENG